MHRHEVEPEDAASADPADGPRTARPCGRTRRPSSWPPAITPTTPRSCATPRTWPRSARLSSRHSRPTTGASEPWDVIDLRRLRDDDPVLPALVAAFSRARRLGGGRASRRTSARSSTCPTGGWDDYLATLDKKARHEIRRKIRRAEAVGRGHVPADAARTADAIDAFIELHQARWGEEGLFPATEGGERSRRFIHRLAELEARRGRPARSSRWARCPSATGSSSPRSASTTARRAYFYNAGMDPEARDLSPGVTGTAEYIRDRLEAGRTRFDFLRGDEPYKYEWGAKDEPIDRFVVSASRR